GILFFFTAHLIESTILPLELIFEHRNYLPSLFLFLPAAAWITRITTNQNLNIKWRSAIAAVIPLIVIFLGINTYIRNSAWVSEESLWRDALSKAPNSGRAAINLAKALYRSNKLEEALRLSEQAYDRRFPTINNAGALSFNGRGVVYYRRGNFESASDFFKKSLQFKPDNFEALTNLILTLLHLNQMEEALHYIANHGQQNPPLNILHLQGTILLKLNRPTEALHIFRNIQMKQPLSVESMIGIGRALTLLKHYRQADFFLRQTAKFSITGSLCAIENDLLTGNQLGAEKTVLEMADNYPMEQVLKSLSSSMADPKEIPIDIQLLNPFVRRHTAMALAKQNDCRAYLNEPQNRNNMD
ncbi:MAG: tetratricopeptide repeat protein, partial [Pseudomonadota bacterium]